MIPKQTYIIVEATNINIINSKLYQLCSNGWKPYGDLKVLFYGTKDFEKIYLQSFVYNRSWIDYLFKRKLN